MKSTWRHRSCPVCESEERTPLIPSVRFEPTINTFLRSSNIELNVCHDCGVVYENPCIVYLESSDFAANGYYIKGNEAEHHNKLQKTLADYRWQLLGPILHLTDSPATLDVGATGAWSNKLKKEIPKSNNHLVEPSSNAIELCSKQYPEVTPYNYIFDSPEFNPTDRFDLISFFYSFYCMDSPRDTLSKVYRLLKKDGKILINISHVLMENEIWDANGDRPWVEMEHIARGTPVVYYDKNSLSMLLALEGFKIDKTFTFQHPRDSYFQGRQETFVVASKAVKKSRTKTLIEFNGKQNALNSKRTVLEFCRNASKKSIILFLKKHKAKSITLLCDDAHYAHFIDLIFDELDVDLIILTSKEIRPSVNIKSDFIFNSLERQLTERELSFIPKSKLVEVIQPVMFNTYDLTTTTKNGNIIMTRSCLPQRSFGDDIFPWKKSTENIKTYKGSFI